MRGGDHCDPPSSGRTSADPLRADGCRGCGECSLRYSASGRLSRILRQRLKPTGLSGISPNYWQKTAHFLLLSGYLNYRLTGEFKDSAGSQVGYVPFDFKKQDWCADSDWKWHSMAIKRYMLPALTTVGEPLGAITADAAEATALL